ncbi:hypothetical protein [Lyngbya confervoides]|uniref:Uncharacterized protein n=1 Tax=Lyngbya confervoides BDU141951 TaxID=1574623 RepID=A0ABD4T169_9CYAN|nr:hypothetical protein [Lyngbya confervoides]MCM1982327.1 hypothetical protein [Lyngbya confervoides BDU141951]
MNIRIAIPTALGICSLVAYGANAQTTNNISAPNNAQSTANPVVDLNQNGALVNTQVNNNPLGRSVVGNGVADCSSSGIALSVFGNGVGPFDTGSIGGAFTYTQSFGMETCQNYAKSQLAKSNLETCLMIISNYSKISKAGIQISYQDLQRVAGVNCPRVVLPATSLPENQSYAPGPEDPAAYPPPGPSNAGSAAYSAPQYGAPQYGAPPQSQLPVAYPPATPGYAPQPPLQPQSTGYSGGGPQAQQQRQSDPVYHSRSQR